MIKLFSRIYKYIKRKLFTNKYKLSFVKKIRTDPANRDLHENLHAFRYLCHQLDKTTKNTYDPDNIRGFEKFQSASKTMCYLKDTEWKESPDVIWGKNILKTYELWMKGEFNYDKGMGNKLDQSQNSFKDVVYKRRSVRFWTNDTISKKDILSIMEMGTMAPTSCNRQAYRLIVVKNEDENNKQGGTNNRELITKAPYIVYIAIDRRLYPEKFAPAIDAGIVAQNIMLAIKYFGYGACPMYHCESYNQKKIKEILQLDEFLYIYLAIPFGVPAENPNLPLRAPVEKITDFITIHSKKIADIM